MRQSISVIVPAYNEEKLIGKCLDYLKNQTFPKNKYEILVVDNDSTDNTSEIAKKFGVKVIHYKEKQGFAVTKQLGAKMAVGEIIAFCDADTFPEKDWLESINKLMQDERLKIIGGTAIPSEGGFVIDRMYFFFDVFARINQIFGNSLLWGFNMAVRKNAFLEIGGFNLDLTSGEDWDISARMRKRYGKGSSLYTNVLRCRTSPRKLKKLNTSFEYFFWGLLNYVSIFISHRSITFGKPHTVR